MSYIDLRQYVDHMSSDVIKVPQFGSNEVIEDEELIKRQLRINKKLIRLINNLKQEYIVYTEAKRRCYSINSKKEVMRISKYLYVKPIRGIMSNGNEKIKVIANEELYHANYELSISNILLPLKAESIPNFHCIMGVPKIDSNHYKIAENIGEYTLADSIINGDDVDNIFCSIYQVLNALYYAHRRFGFNHNDISPHSIFIYRIDDNIKIRYPSGHSVSTNRIAIITDYSVSSLDNDDFLSDIFRLLGWSLYLASYNPKDYVNDVIDTLMKPFLDTTMNVEKNAMNLALFRYNFSLPSNIGNLTGKAYVDYIRALAPSHIVSNATGYKDYLSTSKSRKCIYKKLRR